MFSKIMAYLGYEKTKPAPVRANAPSEPYRLTRYVMAVDLPTYIDTARLHGFDLRIARSTDAWITLWLSPREVYLLESHNLALLR